MNRWQLGSWLLLGVCVGWSAGAAETLPSGMHACMAESDAAQRLACFDRESARLTQPAAPAAPAAAPAAPVAKSVPPAAAPAATTAASAAPVVAQSGEEKFGYRGSIARAELDKKEAEEKKFEALTAKIAEIQKQPLGQLVLTLDNGQVWQQKAGERAMRLNVGDSVTIRRASLGSFLLTSDGPNGSMRVSRVK